MPAPEQRSAHKHVCTSTALPSSKGDHVSPHCVSTHAAPRSAPTILLACLVGLCVHYDVACRQHRLLAASFYTENTKSNRLFLFGLIHWFQTYVADSTRHAIRGVVALK